MGSSTPSNGKQLVEMQKRPVAAKFGLVSAADIEARSWSKSEARDRRSRTVKEREGTLVQKMGMVGFD